MFRSLFIILFLASYCHAQNSNDARQVTDAIFLSNATVISEPGKIQTRTDILVRDGMIVNVSRNMTPPYDAMVIDADSLYVYAAFIMPATHVGYNPMEKKDKEKIADTGNPTWEQAGVTPHLRASDRMDFSKLTAYRDQGFGVVHVVPNEGMLSGKGAILTTSAGDLSKGLLREDASQFMQFKASKKTYPRNLLGVMAMLREVIINTQRTQAYLKTYEKNPVGKSRPVFQKGTQELFAALDGRSPFYLKTGSLKNVLRAITLQNELGLKNAVLTDVNQISDILPQLKKSGSPLLLSMDLPEVIKQDSSETDEEKLAYVKMQNDAIQELEAQAALLENQNVLFGFSMHKGDVKKTKELMNRMIKAGLSEKGALAALTTAPAKILGLDQQVGKIEKGMLAQLILTDTSYFSSKSRIVHTLIDGEWNTLTSKSSEKSAEGLDAFAGLWDFEVAAPGETHKGRLKISRKESSTIVEIASEDDLTAFDAVSDVALENDRLSFTYVLKEGDQAIPLTFSLALKENSLSGTMNFGGMGESPVTGNKVSPETK